MKLLGEEEEYSRRLWRSLAAQQWQCSGGLGRERERGRESPTASPLSQWADGRQPPFIPSAPAKDSDEERGSPRAARAQPIGHPLPAASASPSPHTPISLRWKRARRERGGGGSEGTADWLRPGRTEAGENQQLSPNEWPAGWPATGRESHNSPLPPLLSSRDQKMGCMLCGSKMKGARGSGSCCTLHRVRLKGGPQVW